MKLLGGPRGKQIRGGMRSPRTVPGTSLLGTRLNRTLFKLFHEDQMQVKGKHKEICWLFLLVICLFIGLLLVLLIWSVCFSELNKSIYWFNYKQVTAVYNQSLLDYYWWFSGKKDDEATSPHHTIHMDKLQTNQRHIHGNLTTRNGKNFTILEKGRVIPNGTHHSRSHKKINWFII